MRNPAILEAIKYLTHRSIPARAPVLLILSFLVFFPSAIFASQGEERKKVLVLFSFRPTLPVSLQYDKGIRSVIEKSNNPPIILNNEFMDMTHFTDDEHSRILSEVYQLKYSNQKPDLIIAVAQPAIEFVLKYRDSLFPNIPIVFGAVEKQFTESRSLGTNITGYLSGVSYKETLELALKLQPDIQNVVLYGDAGPIAMSLSESSRSVYQPYEKRLNISYLMGLPMESLLDKMSNLPEQSIVLELPLWRDGAGKEFIGNEALEMVASSTNAPVYSFWDVSIGTGIVGGYVNSFDEEGKEVARLGLRILSGENPDNIPIINTPSFRYMVDYRTLKRWSISEDRLPPGTIVKFKELTIWDRYKTIVFISITLIVLQALFISYLLYLRRTRRQIEQNYRTVADYTHNWEYWQNPDGSFQYISPSCERISGYSVQDFERNPDLLENMILTEDKAVWDKHHSSAQDNEISGEVVFRIQRSDGEIRWIEHICKPIFDDQGNYLGIRASNRDITQREFYRSESSKLRAELAHMDRVITINTLTSALAHEINQPLAAIRSYAQAALRFMKKEHPEYDSVQKALQGIVADNKRAAEVINRSRDLIKKEPTCLAIIDINSLIHNVLNLMNSELVLRNTSVTLELTSENSLIQGDSIQIQQVLINLLTNALDAMDGLPIGERNITITTKPGNLDDIIVLISDSGEGVSPETNESMFSPFYTTKSTGIGLGLSISKSIIEAHGGKMYTSNNSDGGATLSFTLPKGNQDR